MWSRAELKSRGKAAFTKNYWKCVLVGFIITLLTGMGSMGSIGNYSSEDTLTESFEYYEYDEVYDEGLNDTLVNTVSTALLAVGVITAVISLVVGIFVANPMEIGAVSFFTKNAYEYARPSELLEPFKNGRYWSSVSIVFQRNLFISLWALLLVVPGVIKSYEYRMVTYLIAEFPEMSKKEAFKISKEMMRGNKLDAFVLDLSFIGWHILNLFTCGILNIFYVQPYVLATDAELYITLRNQYFYKNQDVNNFTEYA